MIELLPYVGCFVAGAVVWHFSGTQFLVAMAALEARIKSLESSVTSIIASPTVTVPAATAPAAPAAPVVVAPPVPPPPAAPAA